MTNLFFERAQEKGFLIMAHRGFWGGNVIQNTIEASKLAYRAGADIVEVDIYRSIDGEYYLFHDKHEEHLLGIKENFKQLTSKEIDATPLINTVDGDSGKRVEKLADFLDWLPKGSLVNMDRVWPYLTDEKFWYLLRTSGKREQIFIKSMLDPNNLSAINQYGSGINYMPLVWKREDLDLLENYDRLNLIGLELIVEDENSSLLEREWLSQQKDQGLLILYNAEYLTATSNLFLSLTDDEALFQDDLTWQKMLEYQADIIQTDWPNFLKEFRQAQQKEA